MIHEIAEIEIRDGTAAEFEAAVEAAVPIFRAATGCLGLRLERGIEKPDTYRLVVGWARIEDHVVTFRGSAGFAEWRALAGPYFARTPRVDHVATLAIGFSETPAAAIVGRAGTAPR